MLGFDDDDCLIDFTKRIPKLLRLTAANPGINVAEAAREQDVRRLDGLIG